MIVNNVKVYGLENSIRSSGFPMRTDVGKKNEEFHNLNLQYWLSFEDFLPSFYNYQLMYNKNKGKDNLESCYFCSCNSHNERYKNSGHYYCSKCRHQLDRYGEVFEVYPKFTLLNDYVEMEVYGEKRNSQKAKISYASLPKIFGIKWSANGKGYIISQDKGALHTFLCKDYVEPGQVIDHINKDIFDNRLENLRICSHQENSMNCKISRTNTSGATGVSWDAKREKWRAYITYNGKQKFLGYYLSINEAIKARLIGEYTIFGQYAPQRHLFKQYGIMEEQDIDSVDSIEKQNLDFCSSEALQMALKDYGRLRTLGKTSIGTGHDNFENGIIVQFDLTASLKMWTEIERYHFWDYISSQSTMHCISKFNLKSQCNKYVDGRVIEIVQRKIDEYNKGVTFLQETRKNNSSSEKIRELNNKLKEEYLEILYNVPSGFELTASMTTNYRQLKTVWRQRRDHRLPEWREFCKWIETLPYAKELICYEKGEN